MQTILELEDEIGMCKSRIKYIIKLMGILPAGKIGKQFLYDKYQVELIKDNNQLYHEKFITIESKMNKL